MKWNMESWNHGMKWNMEYGIMESWNMESWNEMESWNGIKQV
jgi:hypothetical protein